MKVDLNKKTLMIVESPTKAKTISGGKFLPPNIEVMHSEGHIDDLDPKPADGRYGIDVENGYCVEYISDERHKKIVKDLKKALKDREQLVLATDPDREGEAIAYHLMLALKPVCPVFRVTFHAITKESVSKAFDEARDIDMELVEAQEARRIVDRLQGYGISSVLRHKLGGKYSTLSYSAGRIQSPCLSLIVARERERMDFVPSEYASLSVECESGAVSFKANLLKKGDLTIANGSCFDEKGRIKKNHIGLSEEEAKAILISVRGRNAEIVRVESKVSKEKPNPPFSTASLLREAGTKFRWGAQKTTRVAESLFQNGFITYMRTDSVSLSDESVRTVRKLIAAEYGDLLSKSENKYVTKSKNAQEAHEAITPTRMAAPDRTGLFGDELRLYDLIWKRTLASQMADAVKKSVTIALEIDGYRFSGSETGYINPAWRSFYDGAKTGRTSLDGLKEGSFATIKDGEYAAHRTEAPSRYTEASLINLMEEKGLGRPSTYASFVPTLTNRGYIVKGKNDALIPTFTGFFVCDFLENNFGRYVSVNFTSEMEEGLDDIASGKKDRNEYLDEFWKKGLESEIDKVSLNTDISEVRELGRIPGLKYSFEHGGKSYKYSLKTGKFGPYIDFSENGGSEQSKSINSPEYIPGTFTDKDAERIIFPEEISPGYRVLTGKYGRYIKRVSDGENFPMPQTGDITEELINLCASLPKTIGEDGDGNEAVLKIGKYGFYVAYLGENRKVKNPFEVTMDNLPAGRVRSELIKEFPPFEDKNLALYRGKYGAYLKWGKENLTLKNIESPEEMTQEEACEYVKNNPGNAKKRGKRR